VSAAVTTGAIAGAAGLYLLVVGIFARFNERPVVTGVVTLGWLLLALLAAAAGYRVRALGRAAIAGLVAGAVPAGFLAIASAVNLRPVLVSVSPALLEILTFGRGLAFGVAVLVGGGVAAALAGAGVARLPAAARRPLLVALATVLLVSLLEPLLRVVLVGVGVDAGWLYRRGGLTASGALVVLAVAAALSASWVAGGTQARARVDALAAPQRRALRGGALAVGVVVLLALPQVLGPFLSEIAGTVGLYVLLGIGLNIVVGSAGLLHLGYVAFFAVGAYTVGLLTSAQSALGAEASFWLAVPVVVLVAAFAGIVVGAPVLRLRGDYLAIVTLAFGEIARILVLSDWLRPVLGGAQGILGIPAPTVGGLRFRDPQSLYYLIVAACLAAAFVAWRLEDSRVGRAWTAMREDEQVAEVMGINIARYKLLAFALGAGVGSLSGAFFAVKIGSVFPNSFSILVSITALSVVILGGIGSLRGVVVGAAVLVGLPDLLREFGEYRLLIYGALLVAIMVLRPQGLLPNVRRSRELEESERAQDQWFDRTGEGDRAPTITAADVT
jgi:branched-chain amino acid transport system permease protein